MTTQPTSHTGWDQLASDESDTDVGSNAEIRESGVEASETSAAFKLPPRTEKFDQNTGVKTIITYQTIDDSIDEGADKIAMGYNTRKIVQKNRVEIQKVAKAVANRRKLAKFGLAINDPPGPNPSTTSCKEEIEIQYSMDELVGEEQDKDDSDTSRIGGLGAPGIQCLYCKLGHLTQNCPNKPLSATLPIGGTGDRYVPPNKRPGAPGAVQPGTTPFRRPDEPTIRVTNLPEEIRDSDLRELFERFGRITRTFMPRDKFTNRIKGFAFVSFDNMTSAMTAAKVMNNFGYAHLLLEVQIAEKRN